MAQSTATKGFLFLVFFQLVIGIQSVELNKCQQFVTDRHIKYLDDMIDNQMESLCTIKVKLLKRKHLSDYCYIRGSVYLLGDLLRKHMLFKINSISFNRTQELTQLYNNGITECMLKNGDSIMRKPKVCSETKDLSLAEILETVRELFKDAKEFREKFSDHHNCAELYKECEEEDEGKEYPPEEPINDEKTEHGLWGFFLPLIFIFGLLSSGLLCYRKYRRRSRLNGNQRDPEIPEERALQSNFMEMNDV
ncbi:uncharacterized protein LOC128472449 isoform X3 [Spea bombifrons]|uniref:uncharacterized protein LOC128472449 isoform X3 n=1 Tax=Spea bombifrons TaxID=233779 RepID=UPI0023497132|nr:uncharacterized protein LOC128472449 isoform X3 [Spea bombifrons]